MNTIQLIVKLMIISMALSNDDERHNFFFQTYFAFDSRAEQQMEVYLRYGQHPELYPNRRGEVVQG